MLNINLFGGPCTGKTTTASGLFHEMKKMHLKVEYVTEYAKDLTYTGEIKNKDQLEIFTEQRHRLNRLIEHVDFAVHDSPFIMGLVYTEDKPHLPKDIYTNFVIDLFKTYNHINIFLQRNLELEYQEYGRSQTLEQSIEKDNEIKKLLDDNGIKYISIPISENTHLDIINLLKEKNEIS